MIVDGGPPLEPPDRTHQDVEAEDDAEGEHHQQERESVGQPPGGELRDVETGVVLEQRVGDAVGHALPGQRHLLPALRAAGSDQQAEERTRADRDGEENARGERLAKLEVGHVAANLHRADGAIDHQKVADEPGGCEEEAGEVQRQPEHVPVGEEIDGGRGDLRRPPAVGEQPRHPPADEQEGDESGDRGDQPAAAAVHGARLERPARRASRRPRRGRRPAPPHRSPRSEAPGWPGCSRREAIPSRVGR